VLGPIIRRNLVATKDGVYFISGGDPRPNHTIRFFRFATRETESIALIEFRGHYISISPDGRWILYPQLDFAGSDLMLVENFR
jgi:hypothetical protein